MKEIVFLELFNDFLWRYIGITSLMLMGIYLSIRGRFSQVVYFPRIVHSFFSQIKRTPTRQVYGVHPIQAFFASVGGAIGVGNLVGIITAIQIGGPGAIFWAWIAALFGMVIKYSEVVVGLRYRVKNTRGSYDGGPMYYLAAAFKGRWAAILASILLCIYGVETYIFNVMTTSFSENWGISSYLVVPILLLGCLFVVRGGVASVGKMSAILLPIFFLFFISMSLWVLIVNVSNIPQVITLIFSSAFSKQAALGGFAGSTVILTIVQGVKQGCYSGDIGIGFASVIHSESSSTDPKKQAVLAVFGVFLDTFVVCSLSVVLVLITGLWQEPIASEVLVQTALALYFPYINLFMPIFLFLLGFSTLTSYFIVGLKAARFLHSRYGSPVYITYGIFAWIFFSFTESVYALLIMNIAGGLLLALNICGLFKLRKTLDFTLGRPS